MSSPERGIRTILWVIAGGFLVAGILQQPEVASLIAGMWLLFVSFVALKGGATYDKDTILIINLMVGIGTAFSVGSLIYDTRIKMFFIAFTFAVTLLISTRGEDAKD